MFKSVMLKTSSRFLRNKLSQNLLNLTFKRGYHQIKDLNQIVAKAADEEAQRSDKFLEYTHKIYKPSKTITFNRDGEVLLFSCDNLKHSQVYFKYPYILYDALIPLAFYSLFLNPCI